ncbi:hypothetical protein BP6252_05736 [Coleophoma cylindrospora]|uniref:5-Methylcytosine G/T mismatch-specific DNA glycosylase n=1 Tax=Coleophoma cylindrospora TaxID=1849047 RepID=A0A3D8RUG6_9HELO|nr:hypothetical protein BP6252_05736 [Coleophoma cylindrospora]
MPREDKEAETEERPSERRRRTKSEKDPNRPHKSRSSKPKIDPETGEPIKSTHRRKRDKEKEKDKEKDIESSIPMASVVPELARTASAPGSASRSSLPYPSFNKNFSKESVNSREDLGTSQGRKASVYTPETTDSGSANNRSKSADHLPGKGATVFKDGRPPSPPDTEASQERKSSAHRMGRVQEEAELESRPASRTSGVGRSSSTRDKDDRSRVSSKSKASKASTAVKTPKSSSKTQEEPGASPGSAVDSNATSVAPKKVSQEPRKSTPVSDSGSSLASAQDSSPRTPTQTPTFLPPSAASVKTVPSPFIPFEAPPPQHTPFSPNGPPPPPPPPVAPASIPRVDYLMQNGGLVRPVPKTLLSAPPRANHAQSSATPIAPEIEKIFGPYYNVLDQYEHVLHKNGSLAVATGYRSVARRLLDRLENVFARDLSSEGCVCVMCQNLDYATHEGSRGLGWGEVLEWVSGRRELPMWPAFDFATLGVKAVDELAGLGISGLNRTGSDPDRPPSPVKLDPDIAEEFRAHYLEQSKKTKAAVNRWLSSCPQTAAAPPQEVDDETLSFAILTHLDQHDRPIFNALLAGSTILQPATRAPTQPRKPRSDFIVKTVQSLQRLYRLPVAPRDPEAAIFLLKNPHTHNLLATLSGINTSEWEILTSGRFDGFLWSGADLDSTNPSGISRGPTPSHASMQRGPMSPSPGQAGSRTTTPFSPMRGHMFSPVNGMSSGYPSRASTPGYNRNPVSIDEEAEIAVLAEVEREIYLGMEALEDAFESLHRKAELVRQALRERGTGLQLSIQSRGASQPDILSASTPGLGPGYERPNWMDGSEIASESDWDAGDDMASELAPDDSASNISSSRHRRPKRRTERRTPALVEEEDED